MLIGDCNVQLTSGWYFTACSSPVGERRYFRVSSELTKVFTLPVAKSKDPHDKLQCPWES